MLQPSTKQGDLQFETTSGHSVDRFWEHLLNPFGRGFKAFPVDLVKVPDRREGIVAPRVQRHEPVSLRGRP